MDWNITPRNDQLGCHLAIKTQKVEYPKYVNNFTVSRSPVRSRCKGKLGTNTCTHAGRLPALTTGRLSSSWII